jgi:SAM-dependent methyltransferase
MHRSDVTDRSELYRRLPLLETDRWWLEQAAASPDGRVLELGAGTGRLTAAFLAAGCQVTAVERDPVMLARLRALLGSRVEVIEADVTDLPDGPAVGLVALPAGLLNELATLDDRRAALAGAARRCRPDGVVALQLLSPWWLVRLPPRSSGWLHPADGSPAIEVSIEADDLERWAARRQATLRYRFADGPVLRDHLDAGIVTPEELQRTLASAGLQLDGSGRTAAGPGVDEAAWEVIARPAARSAG